MKIITKSNFGEELYKELIVATNVNEVVGKQMVEQWNDKYQSDYSDDYLALVEDDYVEYDGYKEVYGEVD